VNGSSVENEFATEVQNFDKITNQLHAESYLEQQGKRDLSGNKAERLKLTRTEESRS